MTVIRPITGADVDAVAAIRVRSWQVAYAGLVPAEHLATMNAQAGAHYLRTRPVRPDQHTLVIETGGRIAGFVSFGPYRAENDAYDTTVGQIYAIYLSPEDWGRGFGARLLLAARSALAASGYPAMRLWVLAANHRARRFYERMGLAPDGATATYSAAELPELRYATAL